MAIFASLQNKTALTPDEIARRANIVHQMSGGRGNPFTPDMFDYNNPNNRLRGDMCACGVDEKGNSNGDFVLLPLSDKSIKEGGKAYMRCMKCGCFSHL